MGLAEAMHGACLCPQEPPECSVWASVDHICQPGWFMAVGGDGGPLEGWGAVKGGGGE